jgi:hypothetical protein
MALIDNQLFTQTNPSGSSLRTDHAEQHSALNNETNSIEDTLVQGYVREAATVNYVSASSFNVSGDVTAIYTTGRIVRFSDGTTGVVTSSSYSNPNTTVNITDGTVPSSLSYVDIALQAKGGTRKALVRPLVEAVYDNGNITGSVTINMKNGVRQKATLTGNVTLDFSNPVEGQALELFLIQDATGGRTISFTPTINWQDNATPIFTTTANKANVIVLRYIGTSWYGIGAKFA